MFYSKNAGVSTFAKFNQTAEALVFKIIFCELDYEGVLMIPY